MKMQPRWYITTRLKVRTFDVRQCDSAVTNPKTQFDLASARMSVEFLNAQFASCHSN